jgi:hypothetical protein
MRRATKALAAHKVEIERSTPKIFGCAICGRLCAGSGHSAWPIFPDGVCCDSCYEQYVARPAPLRECLKAWGMEWELRIPQSGGA